MQNVTLPLSHSTVTALLNVTLWIFDSISALREAIYLRTNLCLVTKAFPQSLRKMPNARLISLMTIGRHVEVGAAATARDAEALPRFDHVRRQAIVRTT